VTPPRASALLILLVACSGKSADTGGGGFNPGPTVAHSPGEGALTEGEPLALSASAEDPDGVADVVVYHRTTGSTYWELTALTQGEGTDWSGEIPVYSPGIEYYFRARDGFGAEAFLPEDQASAPFAREVRPATRALPFVEDFEVEAGQTSLSGMGWRVASEGFDFYAWTLSPARASSGANAAFHARGASSSPEMIDWLVSPPLDLRGLDQIQLTWQEVGAATANAGTHGLYISTSSPDPLGGGFEPVVAELPLPGEGAFGRSAVVDLSAWSGAETAWLAWRYQGTYADDWTIDDVRVEALAPDLSATLSVSPSPVHPGEEATLTFTLINATAVAATGLTAALSLPDGGGEVDPASLAVPEVPASGSTDISFTVALDPDLADNRTLPVLLTLTGPDTSWSFPDQMLIGLPSTGRIDLSFAASAIARVSFGQGDPAAPDVEVPVHAGLLAAGEHSFEVDLTSFWDRLPPGPGPDRWWAQVTADQPGAASLVSLTVGGAAYSSIPGGVQEDEQTVFYVPPPPQPRLGGQSPTSAAPGDSGLPLTLVIVNDGEVSAGAVSATLVSTHPDLTLSGAVSVTADPDLWTAGEALVLSGATLDIAAGHTDSQPVTLAVELDDGADQWTVPVSVAVPWPVLRAVSVEIRDDGGDGILDAGEAADLEITVANTGDRSPVDRLAAVLEVAGGSVAAATLLDGTDSLSALSPGATGDVDFELQLTSGVAGDPLDLEIRFDDGDYTYVAPLRLVLGEKPWGALSPVDDPLGDNLNGYGFDFQRAEGRELGGRYEIRLTSAVDIDPSTLFIEAWGQSGGSPYTYYRWVLQSGVGTLEGYTASGGFGTLGAMVADFVDARTVVLSWDLELMDLVSDAFSIGFASGWCGPPSYYCDHYPDGWGYPYDSFSSFGWFSATW
jgi:hypothetical protein